MEAYKVGVTIGLKNLIGPELQKLVEQFTILDKAAFRFQATLEGLATTGNGLSGISDSLWLTTKSMQGVTAATTEATAAVERLNAAVSASRGVKMPRGGGTGGGAGGGDTSSTRKGSVAAALMSPEGAVAGFVGYEAFKGGMSMDDTIARAMIAMQVPVNGNYMSTDYASAISKSVFGTTTSFGVKQEDTQEAALQAIRGLAPLSPDQRMSLLPSLMNFAGAEVLGKHGTSMEEAVEAGIGLAHQMRAYSPEQIEPLLGAFAKLSMASPQSLSQMSRASSYYLPLLTAGLNMDPTELMAMGTVGSQMGLNTKAGTWLARMFQAPFVADLTSKRGSARTTALEELGIVKDGKVVTHDPFEFLQSLSTNSVGMSSEKRTKDFVAAFGQEGARAAAIFTDPTVMTNLMTLAGGLKGAPSPNQLKGQYANSPAVQFGKAEAEFSRALTELGQALMPEATEALKAFGVVLKGIAWVISAPTVAGNASADFVKGLYHKMRGDSSGVTVVQIDGHEVGRAATKYQGDALQKGSSSGASGSWADYNATQPMPSHGFLAQ